MTTWLVSDTHFNHSREFLYGPRGFTSVEEMNEAIIERWNSVVDPDDRVIHLGDTMLNDNQKGIECMSRLNGQICLIYGNHDSDVRKELFWYELPMIITLGYAHVFKHGKLSIYLSHYPTLTANIDDKHFSQHVICFHGHTHSKEKWQDPNNPFLYNVALDAHNCYPVNLDAAIDEIRNKWEELRNERKGQD